MTPEITEDAIERLVRRFYGGARIDPVLGPVFAAVISDWEPHIVRIVDFWSSTMLGTGRYKGSPFAVHLPLPIEPAHFERWLALWRGATAELFSPEAADQFNARAEHIAESLKLGWRFALAVVQRNRSRAACASAMDSARQSLKIRS